MKLQHPESRVATQPTTLLQVCVNEWRQFSDRYSFSRQQVRVFLRRLYRLHGVQEPLHVSCLVLSLSIIS